MTENLNIVQLSTLITPSALDQASRVVGKNKADYEKLKQAFYSSNVCLNNFAPISVDLCTFSWELEGQDRNWWWQLQALPFLNWFVSSYYLHSKEEQQRLLECCISAVHCWCLNAEKNESSPLNWHDHATAFRLRNLMSWFAHCVNFGLANILFCDVRLQNFPNLLYKHLVWLADDNNYSANTNHGFDQALVMYTVALSLEDSAIERFRLLGKTRLVNELKQAFTDEGVHVENSPGYQKFMLGRIKTLVNLDTLGDVEVSVSAKDYVHKAEAFLKALTLPNGELPLIGDTQAGNIGILDELDTNELRIYDYSSSGYVVVKGMTKENKQFYFLLKNSHLSNYHRHDDDLMIYLWFDGEVILGDAGLYSHNEKCNIRQFFRSHYAHNVPFVTAKAVRDRNKLSVLPRVSIDRVSGLIKASSHMFGINITRIVDISEIQNGQLSIHDAVENMELNTNHFIGPNLNLARYEASKLRFESATSYFELKFNDSVGLKITNGLNKGNENISLYSERYNEKLDTFKVTIVHGTEASIVLNFGGVGNESNH